MKEYDVFISHASEDKRAVARPLAEGLRKLGFRVWFDEFELRMGDSLRRAIDKGLSKSNYGVVILSEPFFDKGWTNYEYDALVQANLSQPGTILPIWNDVTFSEVEEYSLPLSSIVSENTADSSIPKIIDSIAYQIGSAKIVSKRNRFELDHSQSKPVATTDIQKGFVSISSKQRDEILNFTDTIHTSEQLIVPTRTRKWHTEFVHWQYDAGDISIIRAAVYDQHLSSMVDSQFEETENTSVSFKGRLHFRMQKNRIYKVLVKIRSKNYFKPLFESQTDLSEFFFMGGVRKFDYLLRYPVMEDFSSITVQKLHGPVGKILEQEGQYHYSARNVLPRTEIAFQINRNLQDALAVDDDALS